MSRSRSSDPLLCRPTDRGEGYASESAEVSRVLNFNFMPRKIARSLGAVAAADFIPPLARPEVTAKRKPAGGEARKEGRAEKLSRP